MIETTINGKSIAFEPLPGEMLSNLLRERLGLTGTKIACNEAECGACTVLLDGEPVLSCTYPASKVEGKSILTIEGLAEVFWGNGEHASGAEGEGCNEPLHPLQQAFIQHGVVQCGFCIPGQIMTSYALLQHNNHPSEPEIRSALKDTLCRCAGYPTIIRAVLAAAETIRTGEPIRNPENLVTDLDHKIVGKILPRPDAIPKVTGKAVFTDDIKFEGMLHARVKRAGVPHAILTDINIARARALPGVKVVLTAADIPAEHEHGLVIYDWPVMVGTGERVRYVGDAVAIVAAETREIASQALELIETSYDLLPVVGNPIQARQPGAPVLHKSGNLLKHIKVRKGNMQRGFEAADIILEHTFQTAMTDHLFMEPECSIARTTADGRLEIYVGSQIPYSDRIQVARVLGVDENRVRIIGQLTGGGFGGKEDIAGQIHAALLAQATGRPVKLLFDRHESLLVHPKRHATQIRVKIGSKNDGRLTAVETELYGDTGAYASLGEKVLTRATTHSAGPYEAENVHADCFAMYTNNPPAGAFRGFGVLQSAFAIESMIDMLADRLQVDPIELRRINAYKVGSCTNTGQILTESVGLLDCIERTANELRQTAGDSPFSAKTTGEYGQLRQAWGFAVGYKNTGLGGGAPDKAEAEVELHEDGTLEVRISSAELGQGLVTVLQMLAAEEFQAPVLLVRVLLMDTDLTPDGGPTTASRQTFVSGNATRLAAQALRDTITGFLAERFDLSPAIIQFRDGLVILGEKTLSLSETAKMMRADGLATSARYRYEAPETQPLGTGGDMHFAYSFGAQAAQVEVDTWTGEVRVLRVISANDVGKAINPLGLQGQVEGGVMMAIGNALTEAFIVEDGIVITDRMARYRIPGIQQAPEITSIVVEHPVKAGPHGAKGVGELVAIPTTPAITNAIFNAVGVRIDRLPVDQAEIIRQLSIREEA